MKFVPFKNGTLLIPSGTYHDADRKHLHVICTDACPKELHVVVSITGWTNNKCDATCKLDPTEHPFLYKPSYVLYRYAAIQRTSVLIGGVEDGTFIRKEPINAATGLRIANGVLRSDQTPRKVKRYLENERERLRLEREKVAT